jgi:hypothetical protein
MTFPPCFFQSWIEGLTTASVASENSRSAFDWSPESKLLSPYSLAPAVPARSSDRARLSSTADDTRLRDILRIALEHGRAEINRAGLAASVDETEKKCDSLLERATKLLAPLGIPQEVLRSLVDAWVRRRLEEEQ